MPGWDDEDKEKPSWREIDRRREEKKQGGGGGGGSSGGTGRHEKSRAYQSYKSQLNKLFDGTGVLPEALKGKLEDSEVAEQARAKREAAEAVLAADRPRKIRKLFKVYREEYGFPEDEDLLAKLLDSDDEDIVIECFETIGRLLDEGTLKRGPSLKARIKTAQITIDAPEIKELGDALIPRLR